VSTCGGGCNYEALFQLARFKVELDKNFFLIRTPTQLEFDYEKEDARGNWQGLEC
jgi:hypothetical protein